MGASFRPDLRLAWWLRRRQLGPRYAFWLLLLGYDVRDPGTRDYLYVPYLLAFWSAYGLIVAIGLASFLAQLLLPAGASTPSLIVLFLAGALLLWVLIRLRSVVRRTPFTFSPADAFLLCQTPLRRNAVALAWFAGEWPFRVAPWAIAGLVLGFALAELRGFVDITGLIPYAATGARGLLVVTLLHLALMSLIWAAGAYRLAGDRESSNLRFLPVTLLLYSVLGTALALLSLGWPPVEWASPGWILLAPLLWPLGAAFTAGTGLFWLGLLVVLLAALAALLLLARVSRTLNLSRASQEAMGLQMRRRSQFGTSTVLPASGTRAKLARVVPRGSGAGAVTWANSLLWLRGSRPPDVLPWVFIGLLATAAFTVSGFTLQGIALLLWVQQTGQHTTFALRRNLAHWWLYGQLPVSPGRLLFAELGGSVLRVWVATGAGIALAYGLVPQSNFTLAWLALIVAPLVALAHAYDILRQSQDGRLLAADVPVAGYVGLGIALLATLICGLLAERLGIMTGPVMAVASGAVFGYFLWQLSIDAFRRVG